MNGSSAFFSQPLPLTSRFALPSRAMLSPMEGIMNRENFFRAALDLNLIDSWMPPFIGIPKDAVPKTGTLRRRFGLFLESGIPLTVQLLGHDPEALAAASAALFRMGVNSVNINCACPSPTVVSSGSGGAVLKNPELLYSILESIRRTVPELCVSVKLRSGFLSAEELPEIMDAVRSGGAHWVIHHFRTVREMYEPVPRTSALWRFCRVRELLDGQIFFANGDILTRPDAEEYRRECSCDGVAVGRGILRNPFLLRSIQTGQIPSENLRAEFLEKLTSGIPGKHGRHFRMECAKMAYGEDSPEFRRLLEQNSR